MTTKVVIACPDNSLHDALIYVEQLNGDQWVRGPAIAVSPRTTAEPIYLTATSRIVIEEDDRDTARPKV